MTSSTSSSMMNYPACLADMSAATLFIGELMPHVNEVILYKKFAPMGTVTSVKLCRDWITGKSLCYAYVNFENPAEAEKAYRSLNYELLEGQPMRIMKSTRNPWLESREDTGCCFHHHHHHHRCCGGGGGGGGGMSGGGGGGSKDLMDPHILVEAIESYSRALKDADENKAPTGYKYSKEFLKRMNIANTQFTNVFIKNFKDLLDDYKLFRLCKPFGEVTSAKVMVDEYGISKGFGFACFTDSDAAQRAVNKLNGLVLDGRTLFAGPALTKSERVKDWGGTRGDYDNCYNKHQQQQSPQEPSHVSISPRICIRNLRDVVDEVRLRKEFERFGPVQQVELLTDNEGRSKGTGYVMYEDQTDAIKAVNSMNGKMIYGARIGVNYVPYTATAATNTYPDTFLLSNHHQQQQQQQQQQQEHPPHQQSQQQRQHAYTNTNSQRHYNHHNQPRLHHSPNNGVRTTGRNKDDNDRDWEKYDGSGLNTSGDSGRGGGIGVGCHGKDSGDNKENVACGTDVDSGVGTGGGGVGGDCNGDCRGSRGGSGIGGGVGGGGSGVNGGSGGGGGSGNKQQVYLQLKDLASSLAHRGHPINIKDIDTSFGNVTNNRNASNNSEINTSNNAVKTASASSSTEANNNNSFEGASSSSTTTTAPTSRRIMTMYTKDKNNDKFDDNDDDDNDKRTIITTRVNSNNDNDHDDNNDSDGDDTRTGKATLLVKNLDESITDYKLESLFNVYGPVVSAKVVSSEFGVSKGFGFVIMAEAQDAVKAIKNLDGRIVVNRPIYISPTAQTKLSAK